MKTWHKIALCVIVVIGVLISVKSCVDKKDADLTLAYIGEGFVDYSAFENGRAALEALCEDVNSDGEVAVNLLEISFNEQLAQADRQNAYQKMTNAVGYGAARVYILEEQFVISNASSGVFADLAELGDGFKNADGETVAISVKGNEKVKKLGIDPDADLYLAVRIVSEIDAVTDKDINKKHACAMKVAEYILNN